MPHIRYMHRPIRSGKATSLCTTLQLPRSKKLHSLIDGLRPGAQILARRIAFPLLFLVAPLALVQPCAALTFQFEETGSLAVARAHSTAVLLPNGQVLVAGGVGEGLHSLADAELYDPVSGTWL